VYSWHHASAIPGSTPKINRERRINEESQRFHAHNTVETRASTSEKLTPNARRHHSGSGAPISAPQSVHARQEATQLTCPLEREKSKTTNPLPTQSDDNTDG